MNLYRADYRRRNGALPMPPVSFDDTELSEIMNLAEAIPVDHRDLFLKSVADAIAGYPEQARGPGAVHREAARLQRLYATAPPVMRRSRYR